ncbi:hypothetical protein EIKCOROL_02282 [Eikenella corrodens ATCC 23834]|uniref:Uncharacterized protein n=1 Tax=Eikenella corrodens ATCC 23834 TaxID=546274 RepID=C0DY20_EIKCO|nr:hypothetical protein EIKCOROL_02282 [Eikenella corrodens ATCC 23834]
MDGHVVCAQNLHAVPSEKRISFLLFHDGYLCAACTFRQPTSPP